MRLDAGLLDLASARVSLSGTGDRDDLLDGIISTAAASAAARRVPGVFVIRTRPQPAVAVVGTLDGAAERRVWALFEQIRRMLETWIHLDYRSAEQACFGLAERLAERVPAAVLDEASYVAIPRGGHIVLGMLATAAGIDADRVGTVAGGPDRPIVVVDDCSLTGNRFAQWLRASDKRRVVFAPLYAPPELRSAIEAAEPRVLACVAAADLEERASPGRGDTPAVDWQELVEGHRYWTGSPAFLSFAWKEPDRSLYNPVTARMEPGWRTVPSSLCLGNRTAAVNSERVQRQAVGPGPIQAPQDVIAGQLGDELVIADTRSGRVMGLTGAGAAMWRAVVAEGTVEGAVEDLTKEFDAPSSRLATDTRRLVDLLASRGLLEHR